MSVINKMLNDLETRQSGQGMEGIDNKYHPPKKQRFWNNKAFIVSLVLVVILGVSIATYYFSKPSPSSTESAVKSDNIKTTNIQSPEKQTVAQPSIGSESAKLDSNITEVDKNLEKKAAVIVQPPVQQINPAVQSKDTAVQPINTSSENSAERTAAKLSQASKKAMQTEPYRPTEPEKDQTLKQVPLDVNKTDSSENTISEVEAPAALAPQLVIEKSTTKLTPEQQIERLMTKAKEGFEKGFIAESIDNLTKVLAISDQHVEARNLLAAAWFGRGQPKRAIAILNDGLNRFPNTFEWRLTAAKIFFKENNKQGALSYLQANLPEASIEYFSMKANLARELQQWTEAESAYQMLVTKQPDVGNWWLGLAIALDSQQKFSEALTHYKNAIKKGKLSSASGNFIKQRMMELEQHGGS